MSGGIDLSAYPESIQEIAILFDQLPEHWKEPILEWMREMVAGRE